MDLKRRDFLKLAGASVGGALLAVAQPERASAENTPEEAAEQPAMLYDTTLCVGCRACQNACRHWNETTVERDPAGLYDAPTDLSGNTWTLIKLYQDDAADDPADRVNWSFVKRNCMHCLDPACVSACTVGALQKTKEGPVIYDVNRCFGCRYCMVACPYHVPRYQWGTTTPLVQKCTFCFGYVAKPGEEADPKNRLAQGMRPNCVESCPTGALTFGKRKELLAEARARIEADKARPVEEQKGYVDHIYGEKEVGGALQLYLSHVPFEKLGLPTLGSEPLPTLTDVMNWSVPGIILGVGGLMTGSYFVRKGSDTDTEQKEG